MACREMTTSPARKVPLSGAASNLMPASKDVELFLGKYPRPQIRGLLRSPGYNCKLSPPLCSSKQYCIIRYIYPGPGRSIKRNVSYAYCPSKNVSTPRCRNLIATSQQASSGRDQCIENLPPASRAILDDHDLLSPLLGYHMT